ncbi:hypothetical protein SDC9_12923 [bioreactor metagenome]|uniref:NAD-specific glutamate dehydrogenase n=1 Tax=bioreactor metagenome TaxID=1076179 RepID=A0A644TLM7_9ZZZZ
MPLGSFRQDAHAALGGRGGEHRIGLERGRDLTRARRGGFPRQRAFRGAAGGERRLVDGQVDRAVRDVDLDQVAGFHERDGAALFRLGRDVADRQPRGAAREATVGEQGAFLAQPLRLQIARRVEHFLHPRAAARPLEADHHDLALMHLAGEDARDRVVLAFEDLGRAREFQDRVIDARGLHDAAVQRDIAEEHRQPAILREGMVEVADHAALAVAVERLVAVAGREGLRGAHAARRGAVEFLDRRVVRRHHVPFPDRLAEAVAVHGAHAHVQQAGAAHLAQNAHDATGAVHVFHVHVLLRRRDLAQAGHLAAEPVDVVHGEVDAALVRDRQQMQHGVGRAAHGDIEAHRVLEGLEGGDVARQQALFLALVMALGDLDDLAPGLEEQLLAVGMGRQHRAVARQRQAKRLGQTVHRVRGEHARAGAAGRAGVLLELVDLRVGIGVIGRHYHRVDQIDGVLEIVHRDLARFHRPARDEDHRDVQPHRGHHHAGGDLVAVRDADHRVGAVAVHHVFDRIRDDLARGQRVEHPVVAHGDAVVDGDGVEFLGDAARSLDLARNHLAQILEVDVARHELGEGVDDCDDRLAEVAVGHAGGAPKATRAGHVAAMGRFAGTVIGHLASSGTSRAAWRLGPS